MSISLKSNADGTTGAIQLNGVDVLSVGTSGNVGIGTSSPASVNKLDVVADASDRRIAMRTQNTSGSATVEAQVNNYWSGSTYTGTAIQQFDSAATGTTAGLSNANLGVLRFQNGSASLICTNGGQPIVFATIATERMRIDSGGNLLVGTTSSSYSARIVSDGGGEHNTMASYRPGTGYQGHIIFINPNGVVGYIGTNGTTTNYTTSSDYRLKHDIQPMTGALAKVQALKPVTYKWNADDSAGEGFIAHELAAVCPDAVTGEKDAVDAEGNPKYQGIDTSFLVATLTAAIQELKAINDAQAQTITALTARVTALEGAQIV